MKKPKHLSRSVAAFSLTEVVLALGVMSFGLVGLIGGLSNSLQSQTGAERDTRLAGISQRILSEYRAQSFDLLVAGNDATGEDRVPICFFNADGEPVAEPAGGASGLAAYYSCEIQRVIDEATQSPNGNANLLNVKMTLRWPYQDASHLGSNTRDLHATVARY
jgi:uncharacterized protein (TIGR02598 family)